MNTADQIAKDVVDAAFKIHTKLGPGLLESAYEACLAHELTKRGYQVERQKPQPVVYDGLEIEVGYRLDILVNGEVILELKAVEQVLPIHHAQLMTYLKLSGKTLGLLINFNVPIIKQGIKRMALHHPDL
ncbi:GxxExxY protein [Luteolibacter arcticus]|uniref:GxxExxY protein n=1 Tax=Luteolibacter arcticus TaxID=1581411 RepID=A0ABT3GNY5_9BACT|nr:GxxExxY protein [Luteolibacter arcticus]MCW1925223.1 GxxExxY protein [Luteolibacter arcticus]